jgi:hypothetical protein
MLYVSNHCGDAAGVDIVLLNAEVARHGEQRSSGPVAADGDNILDGRNSLIRDSLCTHIPCAGLSIERGSAYNGQRVAVQSRLNHVPFTVLDDAAILRPREPTRSEFSLV